MKQKLNAKVKGRRGNVKEERKLKYKLCLIIEIKRAVLVVLDEFGESLVDSHCIFRTDFFYISYQILS